MQILTQISTTDVCYIDHNYKKWYKSIQCWQCVKNQTTVYLVFHMTFTQILHRKNVCQHGFLNISCSASMMVKLFFPLPKCMQTHISKSWLCNTVECFGIKRQTASNPSWGLICHFYSHLMLLMMLQIFSLMQIFTDNFTK